MKKLIFLFYFLLAVSLHAQNFDINMQWSNDISKKMKSGNELLVGLGYIGNTYYARYASSFEDIMSYNFGTKEIKKGKLNFKDENGERKPEFIAVCNHELYAFSSMQDKKNKKHYLFLQRINKELLKLSFPLKKIIEVDEEDSKGYSNVNFSIAFSNDSSKVLIYKLFSNTKNGKALKVGFLVFDKDFSLLWKKEDFYTETAGLLGVDQMLVDNTGEVYLLGKTLLQTNQAEKNEFPETNSRNNINSAVYKIIHFQRNTANIGNSLIQPEKGMRIDNMAINIRNDGVVVGCGILALEGQTSARGVFSMNFNKTTNSIENKDYQFFTANILTKGLPEEEASKLKEKWKNNEEFEDFEYKIKNISLKKDGGFIFVAEKYKYYLQTNLYGNSATTNVGVYGDIFVVGCHADAKIAWIQKIPKLQAAETVGGYMSSFALAFSKADDIFLFYNNIATSSLAIYGNGFKKAAFMVSKIDVNGKESIKELLNPEATNIVMRPRESVQISENEIVVFGQKRLIGTPYYLKLFFE